jgi:hypothetical protein
MAVTKSVRLGHALAREQGDWSGKARIRLSERDIFLVVSLKYSESSSAAASKRGHKATSASITLQELL